MKALEINVECLKMNNKKNKNVVFMYLVIKLTIGFETLARLYQEEMELDKLHLNSKPE